jgi:cell division protein FtsI (penicillin-binding protein 3)
LVLALLVVAGRLVDVQVVHSRAYATAADQELTQTVTIPALRGGIFDRNGAVLAESVPTKMVLADDFQIAHPVTEASRLAPLVGVPAAQLAAELHRHSGYVPLVRQLSTTVGDKISQENLPGITVVDSSRRVVPNGPLAVPVLGLTNASGAGAAGLEYQYNKELAGRSGSETLLESPLGVQLPQTPIENRTSTVPGTGLELTVDEPLQYATEQALAAQISATHAVSGVAEVMDVRTGQVLAMANLVSTAAGTTAPSPPDTSAVVTPGVDEASENLALTQLYEPGSVFKLVTFSAALADGLISPTTVFTVPDQISLDGSIFHDAEPHPTEQLTATEILAQSSNIGTSEIASDVGETRLLNQVQALGFGEPTGLNFPGESPGLLATAAQWEPTNLVSLPIGQVDAVNAQQVLDAYNAVANGGIFVAPKLVQATVGADNRVTATRPSATHRVFPAATDAELKSMLEQVVDIGTGTSAVVPGYTVAGKTGTAQIPQTGQDSYITGAYMASFVGFAPVQNPVLSAIVVLDRPTPIFGGTVAAPVFSQIMSYALHRYGIPTTPGAPSQGQTQGGSTAASQAQDIT